MTPAIWQATIEALHDLGYGVRVQHLRRWRVRQDAEPLQTVGKFKAIEQQGHTLFPSQIYELDPNGGATRCIIYRLDEGEHEPEIDVETRVHPRDNYCKKIGREKALALALDEISMPDTRKKIAEARSKAAAALR